MIYNNIDLSKISTGKQKEIYPQKFLTPVYYNNTSLDYTLKDKYVIINGIKSTMFKKDYIDIKSKEFTEITNKIISHLNIKKSPIFAENVFSATINQNTIISGLYSSIDDLRNKRFQAVIVLTIPTIFNDNNGLTTCQLNVKSIYVHQLVQPDDLSINFENLSQAD